MRKEERITEEAGKYIDAARHFDGIGRAIRSIQVSSIQQMLSTNDTVQREAIQATTSEAIQRAIAEGQALLSPPVKALSELIEPSDEAVYFRHQNQQARVRPRKEATPPQNRFEVEVEDNGSWVAV